MTATTGTPGLRLVNGAIPADPAPTKTHARLHREAGPRRAGRGDRAASLREDGDATHDRSRTAASMARSSGRAVVVTRAALVYGKMTCAILVPTSVPKQEEARPTIPIYRSIIVDFVVDSAARGGCLITL
jgi:hypothetical protein